MDDIRELVGRGVISDTTNDGTRTIKMDTIDDIIASNKIREIVSHPKFVGVGTDRNGALCLYFERTEYED